MFGIGCILSTLMTKPYLTGEHNSHHNETENVDLTTVISTIVNSTIIEEDIDRRSKLKIPYFISGSIQITCK